MTEAEELADFARERFGYTLTGETSPEQIGKLLIQTSAGPELWTGIRILMALGIHVDGGRLSP